MSFIASVLYLLAAWFWYVSSRMKFTKTDYGDDSDLNENNDRNVNIHIALIIVHLMVYT